MDVGYVTQIDYRVADLLEREIVEGFDLERRGIGLHHEVEGADLLIACRQDDILRRQGGADIRRREPMRQKLGLVEVDLDVRRRPAVGRRHRGAGHRDQRRPNEIRRDIVDLARRHVVCRDLQGEDRDRRSIVDQDFRRRGARGQLLEHVLRRRCDLGLRRRHIRARLKEDLHDAAAVIRLALDVLDVADRRGQVAFIVVDDPARHVRRQQAGVGPDRGDDGYPDRRKDVGRRLENRDGAEQQDEDGEDDEGVGPPQRDQDKGVHVRPCSPKPQFGMFSIEA